MWVDANSIPTNDKDMAAFVESLAKAHLNILLPETMRRGYVIYPSKLDEQDPRFLGYDPLAAMVREARKYGMEVHPWVWVFRQGYKDHPGPIFTKHSEWMAVNKWGETLSANGGYWVCPSIPAARDYLMSVYTEIARNYDIDGLHLDYIRFEVQSPTPYCYNDSCRDGFKRKFGVDPMDIDPFSKSQVDWNLWREELVDSFVKRVSSEMRAVKPEIKISAAVGSMPDDARLSLLQNWNHWVDNKWIDFLTPMDYTGSDDTFRKMVAYQKAYADDRAIILPGLGLHVHKSPDTTLSQIDIARRFNTNGSTLFATVYLKDDLKSILASGPFANTAEVPFRKPADRVKTLMKAAEDVAQSDPAAAASYLTDASHLLGYIDYHSRDTGSVPPLLPPLFIPANVIPTPAASVARTDTAPVIDGKMDDSVWSTASTISLEYTNMAQAASVPTQVKLAYDATNLYIGYIAQEPQMVNLKATVTKRDGPTFYDDSSEFFLDPWGKRRTYYHMSANTLGAEFDAKVTDTAPNLTWTTASSKTDTGWAMEIAVPFASLGVGAPKSGDKWFANFARNRWVTGKPEYIAWSVTYGSFHQPERFGTLIFK